MDNFDSMSNDELRVRLLEAGFQNLPITSTTRSVLLKKLKNHIEGEKKKIRRETIHVTKYSSGEESEGDIKKPSRRITVDFTKVKPPVTKRRTGRVTPKENESYLEIQEETDDEIILPTKNVVTKHTPLIVQPKSFNRTAPEIVEEDVDDSLARHSFSKLPEKTIRVIHSYREPENGNISESAIKKRMSYSSNNEFSRDNKRMESSFYNIPSKTNEYSSIDSSMESKHLKQFSKRLSQLRADPLVLNQHSYRHDSYTRPPIKQMIAKDEDNTLLHHFKTLWVSLNQEYSINFYILMLFAVLLTILFIIIFI